MKFIFIKSNMLSEYSHSNLP